MKLQLPLPATMDNCDRRLSKNMLTCLLPEQRHGNTRGLTLTSNVTQLKPTTIRLDVSGELYVKVVLP